MHISRERVGSLAHAQQAVGLLVIVVTRCHFLEVFVLLLSFSLELLRLGQQEKSRVRFGEWSEIDNDKCNGWMGAHDQ